MAQTTLRDRIQSIEDAISAGQIDDAMAHCQQILAHYPDALEIQRLLGEVYLAQGRFDEAQHTFDWILVNDPENVIAYCDRALICEHLSDIDTALDCYQQAYELSRGNSQIRREFNQLSARIGQHDGRMSGDDELGPAGGDQLRHAGEQRELSLRRERRFRLVHDEHA